MITNPGVAPQSDQSGDVIPVGPFNFSPSVQLSWQHRDNIFFSPDDPVADTVLQAGARLHLHMPINQSYVQFTYMPQYTDYETFDLQDRWSHHFNAGGTFVFSNGLVFKAGYTYVLGNLQTREVDPGGELVFGDERFRKDSVNLGLDYWISHRDGFFIDGRWTDLEYDDPRLFYDYTRTTVGVGWLHQINSSLVVDLRYGVSEFDAHEGVFQDNSFRDSLWQDVTIGFNGQLSPVMGSGLRLGYRTISYDIEPDDPPVSEFGGFVAEGFLSWHLGHGSLVRLDVLRAPFPSNFGENANYVATGAGLLYNLDRGRFFAQASGRFQNNDYDLPDVATGEDRSDDIVTLGLGLGYRVNRRFSLWSSYLHEDRQSLYRFSYTANIFTVGLFVGF